MCSGGVHTLAYAHGFERTSLRCEEGALSLSFVLNRSLIVGDVVYLRLKSFSAVKASSRKNLGKSVTASSAEKGLEEGEGDEDAEKDRDVGTADELTKEHEQPGISTEVGAEHSDAGAAARGMSLSSSKVPMGAPVLVPSGLQHIHSNAPGCLSERSTTATARTLAYPTFPADLPVTSFSKNPCLVRACARVGIPGRSAAQLILCNPSFFFDSIIPDHQNQTTREYDI